jgi:hypothetical protein
VRLIFENSTVCLISRRISLFCPVDCLSLALLGVGVDGRGFFDNDSDNSQFRRSGDVALIDSRLVCFFGSGLGVIFRWRV